jgi:hypothetical protein
MTTDNYNWIKISYAISEKIDISHLGHYLAYHYFPEDITYEVLQREMVSINYWNAMKTATSHFWENDNFMCGAPFFEAPTYCG